MPRRLSDRARLLTRYMRGRAEAIPGPSALMIETTVRCNLLCPMCPRTGAGYPNADMPDEMLWPLIEDHAAMGGDHVYLYGLGEPLMDARIFEILARCKSLGLGTVLSSNATLMTAERRKRLIDVGCDHLLVGVDGASEATYSYYREGGKYARVVENIRAFAAEKHAARSDIYLVVQFIRMKENWHEQEAFLAQWQGVEGVDDVRIKEEDIGLPEHVTFEPDGDRRRNPCHTLWRGPLVVRYTGEVFPCYHIAGHGEPIGSLADHRLSELWEGAAMQRLRRQHVARDLSDDPLCQSCPAARPRLPFILGAMSMRGATVRRLVPLAEKMSHRLPKVFSEARTRKDLG